MFLENRAGAPLLRESSGQLRLSMTTPRSQRPLRRPLAVPRVAILVDTSTTWGRNILAGVIAYTRTHGRWQIFVEARGLEEHLQLPRGWQGDGVIARVGTDQMALGIARQATSSRQCLRHRIEGREFSAGRH